MKNLLVIFLLFFFFNNVSFCQKKGKVKFIIYNKTGYDIDSFCLEENKNILIKANPKPITIYVNKITMQGGLPYGDLVDGKIKNKQKNTTIYGLCGTGKYIATKGEYKLDITLNETKDGYKLFWEIHSK